MSLYAYICIFPFFNIYIFIYHKFLALAKFNNIYIRISIYQIFFEKNFFCDDKKPHEHIALWYVKTLWTHLKHLRARSCTFVERVFLQNAHLFCFIRIFCACDMDAVLVLERSLRVKSEPLFGTKNLNFLDVFLCVFFLWHCFGEHVIGNLFPGISWRRFFFHVRQFCYHRDHIWALWQEYPTPKIGRARFGLVNSFWDYPEKIPIGPRKAPKKSLSIHSWRFWVE